MASRFRVGRSCNCGSKQANVGDLVIGVARRVRTASSCGVSPSRSNAPRVSAIVATSSHRPRAVPAAELAALVRLLCARTDASPDPIVAFERARHLVAPGGLVVVAGSIFLVGELRAHLLGDPVDPAPTSDPV